MGGCISADDLPDSSSSLEKPVENLMAYHPDSQPVEEFYDLGRCIGHGSVGSVMRVQHKKTSKWFVLKTIRVNRMSKAVAEEMMNEVNILMKLDHVNIVRPIELFSVKRSQLYLVLPWCSGGDLYARQPYSEKDAQRYTAQIVDAVAYMHEFRVMHRDLKFENVLFATKEPMSEVMVIDFGLAKANRRVDTKASKVELSMVGTLYTMAPEVLRFNYYDFKCDVWALGVIAYMLLGQAMPFERLDDRRGFLEDLEAERFNMDIPALSRRSEEAREFIKYLLVANQQRRPSASRAQRHKWLRGVDRGCQSPKSPGPSSFFSEEAAAAAECKEETDDDEDEEEKERVACSPVLPRSRSSSTPLLEMHQIADQLCKFMQKSRLCRIALMVVAYRRSNADIIREFRVAFRAVDINNSGDISVGELQAVLVKCGYEEDVVKQIFEAIDMDTSGAISYTEFYAALLEGTTFIQEDELADAFDRLSNGSDCITKRNLRMLLGSLTPELAEEIIKEGDYDGNGEVDFDEFMCLMRQKRPDSLRHLEEITTPPPAKQKSCR